MIEKLIKSACGAAKEAGELIKKGFGTAFTIYSKDGKNNLVTEYDKLSEKMIIQSLQKDFPNSVFLAEESGSSAFTDEDAIRWIIDPLDGTVNFAHNLPIFSISIAAEKNKELLCGVIYNPILDELFYAGRGQGAFFNDKKISVSENADFETSFLVTGFPYNVEKNPCNCIDHFVSIIKRGIPVRRLGSAALDLAYVACGRFDGFWEINLNPWDLAAGAILVKEAGGLVTQYSGEDFKINHKSILATNGKIHKEVVETLRACDCGMDF
ncbi:MAG: inositol monophosphatase [Ignavibacteria bacterium]|nr:inositol monophosphatase [Ignavibacteria bacterium]